MAGPQSTQIEQKEREVRSRDAAQQVLVEIIRQSGGSFCGLSRLYKAYYFAHLYYFEAGGGFLSEWPIVRMPNGPGVDDGHGLLRNLAKRGIITIERVMDGPYPEYRFSLESDSEPKLDEAAVEAIRQAVAFVSGKTAAQLTNETHEYSRSWQRAKSGEELNIYIDVLDEEELLEGREALTKLQDMIRAVF